MVALTKTERRIYRALQQRPRSAEELREIVWAHDPNGGPECRQAIYVHVSNLRKRLERVGLTIENDYSAQWGDVFGGSPSSRFSDAIGTDLTDTWFGDVRGRYRIKNSPGNLPTWKEFDREAVYPG